MTAHAPSAGWFEGREHRLPVRVYYEDTDFTGLVYHANYVRYFERGRSDALRLMGVGHAQLLDGADASAFVLTALRLAFRAPARIDDALVVHTTYETMRGPRLSVRQSIRRDGAVLTEAEVEIACIHLDGRPRRAPAIVVDRVRPWLAGSDG